MRLAAVLVLAAVQETPEPSETAKVLTRGKEVYAQAKALHDLALNKPEPERRVSLLEALEKTDLARTYFIVAQDLSEGEDAREAARWLRETTHLTKMIRELLKGAGASSAPPPEPKPAPQEKKEDPPPPPKEVEPPPPLAKAGRLLVAVLSDPASGKAADALNLTRSLLSEAGPLEPLVASYSILRLIESGRLSEEDRSLARAYLKDFPLEAFSNQDRHAAVAFLTRSPGLRLLAYAHLSRLLKEGTVDLSLLQALDISTGIEEEKVIYGTATGRLLRGLKRGDPDATIDKVRDSEAPIYKFWYLLRKLCAIRKEEAEKGYVRLLRDLRDLRLPSWMAGAKESAVRAAERCRPCDRCKGEGSTECKHCENGIAKFVCNRCNGLGKLPTRRGWVVCNNCDGTPYRDGRCLRCRGKGRLDCDRCEGPWRAPALTEMVQIRSCGVCQDGFAFADLFVPCVDCHGTALRFSPARKE